MGNTQAAGMAEAIDDGLVDLGLALHWHLTSNHYPPLPPETLELAKEALKLAAQDDWDGIVDFGPSGIKHRQYGTQVPARVIIELWHLNHFIGAAQQALDEEGI